MYLSCSLALASIKIKQTNEHQCTRCNRKVQKNKKAPNLHININKDPKHVLFFFFCYFYLQCSHLLCCKCAQ